MREVGVEIPVSVPDLGKGFPGPSRIHSDCQKRLLDLELNLDNSVITFETLLWALAELERIEEQRDFPCPDYHPAEYKADGMSTSRGQGHNAELEKMDDRAKAQTQDSGGVGAIRSVGSGGLRSCTSEVEKSDVSTAGLNAGRENLDELPMQVDKNDISYSKSSAYEPRKGDYKNWRQKVNFASGNKRKSDMDECSYDGEKKARVGEFHLSRDLKDAVISAVGGEAGSQMSHGINSRLELPEYVSLTNLVSHCLLISLDQTPSDSVLVALERTTPGAPGGVKLRTEIGFSTSESGEWMWLHRWFVRRALPCATNDTFHTNLDWLVAYMTASHSTMIKLVLDDLVADLSKCEVDGYIAIYLQRTGVLEYAALREPERTSGSLLAMFPSGLPPISVDDARESMEDENKRPWPGFLLNIWLGLSILCPRLCSSFSKLWVPTLSVDVVEAWSIVPRSNNDCIFLPSVWNIIGVSAYEEPKSRRAWLCAAMIKRLPELAPIACHVVLLLSALCDISTNHGTSQGPSEIGYYLLGSLCKVLSKHVLPSVLGVDRDNSGSAPGGTCNIGKDSGAVMFLENLQEHAHLVWRKALDSYSMSRCPCCNVSIREEGQEIEKNGSKDDTNKLEEAEGSHTSTTQYKFDGVEVERGCLKRDPIFQLCQLLFVCCTEHIVADLLASATWVTPCPPGFAKSDSLKRMLLVKKMMQIVVGQGRGSLILELWTQRMTDHLLVASDDQALGKVLAMRQLLDLKFWQLHRYSAEKLSSSAPAVSTEEPDGQESPSKNLVWKILRAELDAKWLPVLSLMHREGAWDLRLAVLGLLQQLHPINSTRSQALANRLKGILGLYFSWLETLDETGDLLLNEQVRNQHEQGTDKLGLSTAGTMRWQYARAMEHMKRIIIKLASCSYPNYTLMVNRLLDFAFEHCPQLSTSMSSSKSTSMRMDPSATPLRRISSTTRTSFSVAPLSTGRLDRYGKHTLVPEWASELEKSTGAIESSNMQLCEENNRIQSDGCSWLLNSEGERFANTPSKQSNGGVSYPPVAFSDNQRKDSKKNEVVGLELGSLLRRTVERAISQSGEASSPWPCHALSIVSSLMIERLETPHEVLMTMEQYEEVLPKHISSLRHIFLAECFGQNTLLMEMLELVVKYGENREVLRCVEFVRVLLADSISRWHSTFRTRRSHSAPPPKVDEDEARSRMQVHRLICLVASAGWLPRPLASSAEIVAVIDGADIADLLLLVWRCMHHAVAFGSKGWGGSSSSLPSSIDVQGLSTGANGNKGKHEETGKEGTYTEWESHFFSILRHNVAQIGPHFARVYPLRTNM